jgi:winged helix DNA-binding protein
MTTRRSRAATTLTAGQLNRATLARQLLLDRERVDVAEAVRRVVALQAQEPASPYLALWNRIASFDPTELDRAFAEQAVIKATTLRITMHALVAEDYPTFHDAMQPTLRAARLNDPRFRVAGLSVRDTDALIPGLLKMARKPRTSAEIQAWVDEQVGALPRPGVWWAIRTYGPLVHAPTGASWTFGPRAAYVAAPDPRRADDPDLSLARVAHRYLEGFGPASVADLAQFAMVPRSRASAAFAAIDTDLERYEGPDGIELFDVRDGEIPAGDAPAAPRLLGMWDNTLLAYRDRTRVVPEEHRRTVIRINGDVLPTVLVDGQVAGVWRTVDDGIEATAFHRLSGEAWAGLETEAAMLVRFLADRDPKVYSRYGHWWAKGLPGSEVRVLGRG